MSSYQIPANLAVSNSGFLFSPQTGETFTLNTIGSKILQLLQKGADKFEIIASVMDEYDIDELTFEKDLTDFLNQLKAHNLVSEK